MQLYLEGGAWFKKKITPGKISFLVNWPVSEKAIKCQQTSWLKDLCMILYEAPDCDKGQVCWPPCDSVFIPMYNKMVYKQTWKIKKIGSVSAKTDSPVSFLSCSPLSWLNSHLRCGYSPSLLILPGLLRLDWGGLSASSPSGEWKDACGLRR